MLDYPDEHMNHPTPHISKETKAQNVEIFARDLRTFTYYSFFEKLCTKLYDAGSFNMVSGRQAPLIFYST